MTLTLIDHCAKCGEWLETDFERKNGLCNFHLVRGNLE